MTWLPRFEGACNLERRTADHLKEQLVYVVLDGEDSAFSILEMRLGEYMRRGREWLKGPVCPSRSWAEAIAADLRLKRDAEGRS